MYDMLKDILMPASLLNLHKVSAVLRLVSVGEGYSHLLNKLGRRSETHHFLHLHGTWIFDL